MSDIKLTFVGTGSAFSKVNYQNNLLVENKDDNLLIDCGTLACTSLHKMGKPLNEINNIFITHLHADHVGGLEEVGFMNKFVFQKKPKLISTINLLNNLWDNTLKGGMNCIQYERTLMEDYFNVTPLVHNDNKHATFNSCGLALELVRTDHIYIEKKFDVPSYGLVMESPVTNKKVLFTGDAKYDYETFQGLFKHVDAILHDCQLFDQPDAVHAMYSELLQLPDDIRAKMWLMHYGDNFADFDPVADGFKGFVQKHIEYDFEEI